ncbi:41192_t:CDS:2, partial [Gigaspora margarita]
FLSNRNPKQRRKAIITQEDYDLIIKILKNPTNTSIGTARDRFWAKNSFYLRDLGTLQNTILQLMEVKNANSNDKPDRAICPFQNLYTVLGRMHGNTHKHSGSEKTFDAIIKQYAYISRSFVEVYVAQCTQYCTKRNFPAPVIGETIISKKFLQRVQTCPLYTKEVAEVVIFLLSVFTVFGSPHILQSNNGREFTAQIIYELLSLWKEIHIINGHPRHPQSQNIEGYYTMQQQTTFNSQQIQSTVDDTNDFTSNRERIAKDKENQNFIDSNNSNDYISSKKRHIRVIQEASNNPTSQHNIYQQVAKIDCGTAGVVLLLGPKEYPELDNPQTNMTVSMIEAARLQSNTLASNKVYNCRDDCLTARCICKKANIVCGSGCHPKNSKYTEFRGIEFIISEI